VPLFSSLLAPPPPTVAIELASRRLTVVELGQGAKGASVVGYASEALPPDAIQPATTGVNIANVGLVADALGRALERAGVRSARRAALIVPDSIARLSLLTFEHLPSKSAEVEQLVRWQLKKATPYPIDDAQVTWFPAHRTSAGSVLAAVAARRDVIAEYEAVVKSVGVHAGLVDLACLNVMNAVISANAATAADWLLISMAPEGTALAIGRGSDLMFYRQRPIVEEEPLTALVHQTAMYHEDRLGGTRFSRVWLCGAGVGREADQARTDIQKRLGVPVEPVDVRGVADLGGRIAASVDVLDALAAPVGVLLRDRKAA
jgi:Tfp pilus assembly PilM family ATPase